MNNILLVARREFRQIVQMKSFWVTLLLIPIALALGPIVADSLDEDEATPETLRELTSLSVSFVTTLPPK